MHQNDKFSFLSLKLAVFFIFLGRAWQHIAFDTPYRALLWDEEWIGKSGEEWTYFTNELFSDKVVAYLAIGIGIYFLICAITALFFNEYKKHISPFRRIINKQNILFLGTILLLFLAFLYCKNKFFEIPQFLEHTIQWSSPLLLIYYLKNGWTKRLFLFMKIAIATTFAFHGIYALGIFPLPVHFMEMTMGIMNIDEASARLFLTIAGVMDFMVAILIFLPRKFMQSALIYAIIWGLLTALARTVYLLDMGINETAVLQGLPETIYRFSHFLVPLSLLMIGVSND